MGAKQCTLVWGRRHRKITLRFFTPKLFFLKQRNKIDFTRWHIDLWPMGILLSHHYTSDETHPCSTSNHITARPSTTAALNRSHYSCSALEKYNTRRHWSAGLCINAVSSTGVKILSNGLVKMLLVWGEPLKYRADGWFPQRSLYNI